MAAASPGSVWPVAFAAGVATVVQLAPPSALRWSSWPVSVVALSTQLSCAADVPDRLADNPPGAAGTVAAGACTVRRTATKRGLLAALPRTSTDAS